MGYQCICNNCGKVYKYGDENSPMLDFGVWNKIRTYYGISKEEEDRRARELNATYNKYCKLKSSGKSVSFDEMDKPELHVFFCTDCMEKALGRKLTIYDILDVPFNREFKDKYFGT